MNLQILSNNLLPQYRAAFNPLWLKKSKTIEGLKLNRKDFDYMLTVASVYSSKIEGNSLDLDSFFVAKDNKRNIKEVVEIDDLIEAYQLAEQADLKERHHLQAHKILSKHFKGIIATQKGKYRKIMVGIRSPQGLVYLAVEPDYVQREMNKLWSDIAILLNEKLSITDTYYYAAFIHFIFAKIHPFADGNGRAGRLLEKWFIAEKLGPGAWGIQSELYYWNNRPKYYANINVGVNYYETLERLNHILPFLQMLPNALL
jgi:Fic family protein